MDLRNEEGAPSVARRLADARFGEGPSADRAGRGVQAIGRDYNGDASVQSPGYGGPGNGHWSGCFCDECSNGGVVVGLDDHGIIDDGRGYPVDEFVSGEARLDGDAVAYVRDGDRDDISDASGPVDGHDGSVDRGDGSSEEGSVGRFHAVRLVARHAGRDRWENVSAHSLGIRFAGIFAWSFGRGATFLMMAILYSVAITYLGFFLPSALVVVLRGLYYVRLTNHAPDS